MTDKRAEKEVAVQRYWVVRLYANGQTQEWSMRVVECSDSKMKLLLQRLVCSTGVISGNEVVGATVGYTKKNAGPLIVLGGWDTHSNRMRYRCEVKDVIAEAHIEVRERSWSAETGV